MHVSCFMIGAHGRRGRLALWMGRALLSAAVSLSAVAGVSAQPAAAVQATSMSFDVPAGALNAAIVRFGRQAGLQFSVDSRLTDKRSTQGIKGRYTAEDGLRTLFTGTGLSFRFTGPRTVVIELPPDADGAKLIGALRIEGAEAGGNGTGGANGSTDATATENTGSYASQGTSVGSKSPESIKSTPQTVSVISSAQIADQKITDLNTAMDYAPGITVQQARDSQTMAFYARGMEITRVQIDGGAPMDLDSTEFTLSGYKANFDMSLYDHVEILRGVDGLFNGNGYAGGVVNLVRKRPLDHFQAKLDTSLGSWDNYRSVLDVTAPLGWDGALRGRAVATWQKRRYFYDGADD